MILQMAQMKKETTQTKTITGTRMTMRTIFTVVKQMGTLRKPLMRRKQRQLAPL